MLFFYVRHGDPIYNPDQLTPLGHRQAEAIGKRLALFGVDEIFASSSNRAKQTAQPTCELLKKQLAELDWCNEAHAWGELTVVGKDGGRWWLFQDRESRRLLVDPALLALGDEWHTHPAFADYHFEKGFARIRENADELFESLGYKHIPGTGAYEVIRDNDERVALFAHQGFGMAFLSCLLDIDYPHFCLHFDTSHTGMTVIEFKEEGGIAIPKVLSLANDGHLYREGLPTDYNHEVRF